MEDSTLENVIGVTLIAKFNKQQIELIDLHPWTTIREVKEMLQEETNILAKRQKLVGLVAKDGGAKGVVDSLTLDGLLTKNAKTGEYKHQFILMGTPEEQIFVDPSQKTDLPDVVDDFELDFSAGSNEWLNHVANGEKLAQFTEKTAVHLMNQPRHGKPLLVRHFRSRHSWWILATNHCLSQRLTQITHALNSLFQPRY
jgi:ubiquitin-like domain-containing CTD phosphatase 1